MIVFPISQEVDYAVLMYFHTYPRGTFHNLYTTRLCSLASLGYTCGMGHLLSRLLPHLAHLRRALRFVFSTELNLQFLKVIKSSR